jgi:peptidyl-tRNA hydrolase, PTH1 family
MGRYSSLKLIVGLGNPGQGYSDNRHNVGFMCVNHFAKLHNIQFSKKKGDARVAEGIINDEPVIVAKPQTFMNASGKAVNALLSRLKLNADDLIVVHDDLDLSIGRIRIRKGGSSGGHKGIQSIISDIDTADFIRIRIGIGRPDDSEDRQDHEQVIDYVLSGFSPFERAVIEKTIVRVNEALDSLLQSGLVPTMNTFNSSEKTVTDNTSGQIVEELERHRNSDVSYH